MLLAMTMTKTKTSTRTKTNTNTKTDTINEWTITSRQESLSKILQMLLPKNALDNDDDKDKYQEQREDYKQTEASKEIPSMLLHQT